MHDCILFMAGTVFGGLAFALASVAGIIAAVLGVATGIVVGALMYRG